MVNEGAPRAEEDAQSAPPVGAPRRLRNTKNSYFATKVAYNVGRLHGLKLRLYLYRRLGMKVGNNCVIRRGVYLTSPNELEVGDGTFIGRANLYCTGGLKIGKNVNVSDGALVITAKHDINSPKFEARYEPIVIQDYAWLATNATVLGGVTVGEAAVLAAGCVVTKDVPPYTVVGGNPARPIAERKRQRFDYVPGDYHPPFL